MTIKKPRKPKSKDVTKSVSDDVGNLLLCKNNGTRIILSLKLIRESRYRRIGVINLAQKTITVKRKRSIHLFLKNNSYGFNHKLLSETKLFTKVRLHDEFGEWLIPNEFILENGKYLNFKESGGFELQRFVTLESIEQFKREPKF